MSFKNIFVCGEQRIPGFERLYNVCHMPIDNLVLGQLRKMGLTPPKAAWSKWNYPEYIAFQKSLRATFCGQPLLNVEFYLWMQADREKRLKYTHKLLPSK